MTINNVSANNITSTLMDTSVSVEPKTETSNPGNEQVSDTSVDERISSRAMNIQKLNEEFFASGMFNIGDAFIERLGEYGLVTESEKERLLSSRFFSSTSSEMTTETELNALTNSIESLIERLTESDPENPLLDVLDDAQNIINLLDTHTVSAVDVEQVVTDLESQLMESSALLTEQESASLTELDLVLRLAGSLGVQNTSSDAINAYLQIYNQN